MLLLWLLQRQQLLLLPWLVPALPAPPSSQPLLTSAAPWVTVGSFAVSPGPGHLVTTW
jgi:hypothetical protein